jgi:hypothetical protein
MRISLATKISLAIFGVPALPLLSSIVAMGSAYRFEATQRTLVAENPASMQAAEELETALLEQRGFVSTHILDEGNTSWLQELGQLGSTGPARRNTWRRPRAAVPLVIVNCADAFAGTAPAVCGLRSAVCGSR